MTRELAHEIVTFLGCVAFGGLAGVLIGVAIRIYRSLP